MTTNNKIPDNFRITSIDIRGDVMYIEGHAYGSATLQTIPIKMLVSEEEEDDDRAGIRTAA